MNDPQVWTLIGVFTAVMLGGMTLMTTQFSRVIRAEVGGLRGELKGDLGELRGEIRGSIGELRGEVQALSVEIKGVESRLTARIQTLTRVLDAARIPPI